MGEDGTLIKVFQKKKFIPLKNLKKGIFFPLIFIHLILSGFFG